MLHQFLTTYRAEIIERSRVRSAQRLAPRPTEGELKNGVPLFLDQLIRVLRPQLSGEPSGEPSSGQVGDQIGVQIGEDATLNGSELLKMGITIAQVVHIYGDICQVVTLLATEKGAPIPAADWQVFNQCQDDAIAAAVTEYARLREGSISAQGTERIGFLAHELRNLINAAMLSFEAIKSGNVGIGGSTGAMLGRSLQRLRDLADRSLAEVRLEARIYKPERVSLAEFIEEIEVGAALDAKARNLELTVAHAEYGLAVYADPQLLASAVFNLLQNAFKFTHPRSHVCLRVQPAGERVLIEVEDECGGLPEGKTEELFRSFAQRGADRSGLGLGLAITRQAVEASGGQIHVRNHPGKGCTFSIELPRATAPPEEAGAAAARRAASADTPAPPASVIRSARL
jgi:signal transduction histidine kinase